jgi:hypothetical protein
MSAPTGSLHPCRPCPWPCSALCTNADFSGANLRGADLESTELEGANLSNGGWRLAAGG